MSSLTRRALLRRIAASAGGALLLLLMSKLTHAAQQVTPHFVFILEGNCYEPVTVDAALAAVPFPTVGPSSPFDSPIQWATCLAFRCAHAPEEPCSRIGHLMASYGHCAPDALCFIPLL